jgi:hypothetical protein
MQNAGCCDSRTTVMPPLSAADAAPPAIVADVPLFVVRDRQVTLRTRLSTAPPAAVFRSSPILRV